MTGVESLELCVFSFNIARRQIPNYIFRLFCFLTKVRLLALHFYRSNGGMSNENLRQKVRYVCFCKNGENQLCAK